MNGHRLLLAFVIMAGIGAAACQPIPILPSGGGGSTPCYVGTSSLTTEQVLGPLSSTLGPIDVAPQPGGLTLTTTASTWSLTANQTFAVSFTNSSGTTAGTAVVSATANGTYTADTAALHFTTTNVKATATFDGTQNGSPLHQSGISLESLAVDQLYALRGAATFACGSTSAGLSSLDFGSFNLSFGPAPCYVGTFTLGGELISGAIPSTIYGPISVTPQPGGSVILTTTPSAWSITAHQTFAVSFSSAGHIGAGTAVVDATARGTLTAGAGSLSFTATGASGSASFNGTVNGAPASASGLTLAELGVSPIYGLSGTASYTCADAASPSLSSLTFTSLQLTF